MTTSTVTAATTYPDYVRDDLINLSENSREVLRRRYLRKGLDGKPVETPAQMFYRVARHLAAAAERFGGDVEATTRRYYDLLTSLRFFPNSPTFTGAGTPLGQLAACFVLPIEDDMGKHPDGIFQTLRNAALIQQTGGGNGFSFGRLRPRGDKVLTSAGVATGPVGFLEAFDKAFGVIAQGGTRRGANMAVLPVHHPDIEEFITCKAEEGKIANFNISVGITDEFMRAVIEDRDFPLINPRDGKVWRTVRARDLFDKIATYAHRNGEPGVLFLDTANRTNPVPHLYELEATNPCVTGDTLVATPSGWRRADSIKPGDAICTVLGVGRVTTVEVNENMPVYKVYFSDGAVIRATASHQFHARDSRTKFFEPRRLDQLKIGDWVRVYRGVVPDNPVPGKPEQLTDREYGFLVGVLLGDGCYTPRALSRNVVRISTHADEREWNNALQLAFARIGAETVSTYVNRGSHSMMMDPKPGKIVADWVKSLPLEPARGPEKRLPEAYINSNREFLIGLLDGLFSTDGSVDLQSNHPLLRFHTSSPALARQVRLILLMFGIYGRISQSVRKRHDLNGREIRHDRPKYDVVISGESLGRFLEQIRLSHPGKQMRLEEAALRCNFTGGNWAARVVRIEPAGVATVYDLYEPKSDTWITEGFVSRGCGEQWLGPYENCCLGSINLARHVTEEGVIDWDALEETIATATRFLDDVVEMNAYVPAVPQLKEAAHRVRRIGLGIMGLADVMYMLGVRYGSEEGEELASQIMEFVRYHAMRTSIELARERGPFPAIRGSIYDPTDLKWTPPTPMAPYKRDFGRPPLNWDAIVAGIKAHGIRNGAQTTIAPTGTIGTVTGCEGYGCEPVFALAYTRYVKEADGDVPLTYVSPLFLRALDEAGIVGETRQRIIDEILHTGTCQHIGELPDHILHTFVVSQDITPTEHVRIQAALQRFVDNSISKCVTGDTLILTPKGLVPIASLHDFRLPDQFAPLALPVMTSCGVQTTDAFYYGGYRETRRVTLEYGFFLEGTPNHRIHVLDEQGRVVFRRLDALQIGDLVVLYGGQNVFGEAAAPLPTFSGTLRTSSTPVRFPTRMSSDLAFFLGCLTAEGAITVNGVVITSTDRALLEDLQGIAREQFGLEGYIARDSRNEVHYLQLNSRALRHWLLVDLGLQAGAEYKIIPNSILQASQDEVAAFLRGLFLDGYMTQDGKCFGITLASRRLIAQLHVLLLNAGILATVRQVGERAWNLTVQGGELERLAEWISFVEVWKNERLERVNLGRLHKTRNYSRLLPEEVTRALQEMRAAVPVSLRAGYNLERSEDKKAYQRARVNLLAGHRLDRHDARRIYEGLKQAGANHPFADAFFAQDDTERIYVRVQTIESNYAEVFDISVPGTHEFIANGICNHNTINFPPTATVEDVKTAYRLAWELGCKGLTVYVTGSREEVVLETKATATAKGKTPTAATPAPAPETPAPVVPQRKRRPTRLQGFTYRQPTPLGTAYITVNSDEAGEPFEVFLNVGKAGSDVAAVAEALGRLMSYILRMPSPLPPRERLQQIVYQLGGIGGGRPLGFGPQRVRSLPDAVAQVLSQFLNESEAQTLTKTPPPPVEQMELPLSVGDLCPDCGQATMLFIEGCKKCQNCGYSEC